MIIAGPNGAGRSTVAPVLLRELFVVKEFANADSIAQGLSAFNPSSAAMYAGRVMLARLRELARQGDDFAFETTLASRSFAPWVAGLVGRGYRCHVMYLWLASDDIAVARVRQRVEFGGHDVPELTVRRRYRRGLRNFFDLYRPLAESWFGYDTSIAGPPRIVASGRQLETDTIVDEDTWRTIQRRRAS